MGGKITLKVSEHSLSFPTFFLFISTWYQSPEIQSSWTPSKTHPPSTSLRPPCRPRPFSLNLNPSPNISRATNSMATTSYSGLNSCSCSYRDEVKMTTSQARLHLWRSKIRRLRVGRQKTTMMMSWHKLYASRNRGNLPHLPNDSENLANI